TYTMLLGVPVLAAVCLLTIGTVAPPPADQWVYPMGLVALPTTGHLLVNWAHQHVTLTFTSLMTLAVPVLSAVGAWLAFSEALTTMQVAGMAVVLTVLAFVVVEGERGRFRTS
ncbi:MAG: DMT family transporter, partial [Acidimicrobiia bacterium]|nr:DMT family transporter [Acidimicrobiia bacterium]